MTSPSLSCCLCTDSQVSSLHQTRDGDSFYICERCGLVFVHPQPPEAPEETFHGRDIEPLRLFRYSEPYEALVSSIFASDPEAWRDRIVVDMGCGPGHMVATLSKLLPDSQVIGVEPSHWLAEVLQSRKPDNATIISGRLDTFGDEYVGQVHAVFLMTVFEHLPDPCGALAQISSLLAEGGWIGMSVPDVMEPGYHGMDRFLYAEHRFYYSETTLGFLLRRHGFELEGVVRGRFGSTQGSLFLTARKRREAHGPEVTPDPLEAERIRTRIETVRRKTRVSGPLRFFYRYRVRRPLLKFASRCKRALKRLLGR